MEPADTTRTPANPSTAAASEEKLKLTSVVGGEALYFTWKHNSSNHDTVNVIFDIIHQCMDKFSNVKMAFVSSQQRLEKVNRENLEEVKDILDTFNTAAATMSKLWKGATNPEAPSWSQDVVDVPLLINICSTVFNSAVSSVKSLNSHYAPFSSEVYGETRYEQMQKIIEQLKFKESDVFVDLGSGVGHLVLYVAGGTRVRKAVGIEKATVPAGYAQKMKSEYKRWMGWYKKKSRQFDLITGDFLDAEYRDLITKEATIVFINNYAFNPDLEQRIKRELLAEMKDGTRIISTKAYATGTKEINDRLLSDVEALLDVRELETVQCPTSWTDKHVPYFLHTVNRAKLEAYFYERAKSNSHSNEHSRRTSMSSKSSHSSREGSQMVIDQKINTDADNDFDDDSAFGPTTRHKWKEYVNDLDRKKRKVSPTSSPRWNEADREYVPPGAKKPKKQLGMVKPVKIPSKKVPTKVKVFKKIAAAEPKAVQHPKSRLSEDAQVGMEVMHAQIVNQKPVKVENEAGLIKVNLSVPPDSPALPDVTPGPSLPAGAVVLDPEHPLDEMLIELRRLYVDYMQQMNTDEYKRLLTEAIQIQSMRQHELMDKVREKESHLENMLTMGVSMLRSRLKELGMAHVETPSELLHHSKRIVAQHKELTQNVSSREAEVACLEGKTRTSVSFGELLLDKLAMVDECPEGEKDKYTWFIQQCAMEAGIPCPRLELETDTTETTTHNGTTRRRPRPRPGPGRKGKTDENSEELEREVQRIVDAAMKVENDVREKECRARGVAMNEKPARRSTGSQGQ
ncbi:unnamed protein product [Auanema sp. JU1783]|nr:unnamed protein product [Auanema sp. JU1783]